MDTEQSEPVPIQIGSSDLGRGIVGAIALMAMVGVGLWCFPSALFGILYLIGGAGWILWVILLHRSDRVFLDGRGVRVHSRAGEGDYAWADLLETGWIGSDWPLVGCGLLVRPKGGQYEVPGPNSPRKVATLAIFGNDAARRGRDVLREISVANGVPFSERGADMLNDPPPKPG